MRSVTYFCWYSCFGSEIKRGLCKKNVVKINTIAHKIQDIGKKKYFAWNLVFM